MYIVPGVHKGEYFRNVYFKFFSCIVFSLFVMKIRLAPPIHIRVTSIITHLLVIIICFDVLCNV